MPILDSKDIDNGKRAFRGTIMNVLDVAEYVNHVKRVYGIENIPF